MNSDNAIDNFEVPLSMINSEYKNKFHEVCTTNPLEYFEEGIKKEDLEFLKSLPVGVWKYIAIITECWTSWHHTSKYFNETKHYGLWRVAEEVLKRKGTILDDYKSYMSDKSEDSKRYQYAVLKAERWEGTKNYPRMAGYEFHAGIIIGEWFYYKFLNKPEGKIYRLKTNANKTVFLETFNSYAELVKKHQEFKGSKRAFNALLRENKLI